MNCFKLIGKGTYGCVYGWEDAGKLRIYELNGYGLDKLVGLHNDMVTAFRKGNKVAGDMLLKKVKKMAGEYEVIKFVRFMESDAKIMRFESFRQGFVRELLFTHCMARYGGVHVICSHYGSVGMAIELDRWECSLSRLLRDDRKARVCGSEGRLSYDDRMDITIQLLAIHVGMLKLGIAHRDLKPQNIVVRVEDFEAGGRKFKLRVRLIDWFTAVGTRWRDNGWNMTGNMCTYAYAPIELLTNSIGVDISKVDTWSLGFLLREVWGMDTVVSADKTDCLWKLIFWKQNIGTGKWMRGQRWSKIGAEMVDGEEEIECLVPWEKEVGFMRDMFKCPEWLISLMDEMLVCEEDRIGSAKLFRMFDGNLKEGTKEGAKDDAINCIKNLTKDYTTLMQKDRGAVLKLFDGSIEPNVHELLFYIFAQEYGCCDICWFLGMTVYRFIEMGDGFGSYKGPEKVFWCFLTACMVVECEGSIRYRKMQELAQTWLEIKGNLVLDKRAINVICGVAARMGFILSGCLASWRYTKSNALLFVSTWLKPHAKLGMSGGEERGEESGKSGSESGGEGGSEGGGGCGSDGGSFMHRPLGGMDEELVCELLKDVKEKTLATKYLERMFLNEGNKELSYLFCRAVLGYHTVRHDLHP